MTWLTLAALALVAGCDADPDADDLAAADDLADELPDPEAADDQDADVEDEDGVEHQETPSEEVTFDLPEQFALGDITCATSSNTDWVNRYSCDLIGGDFCYYATGTTNYHDDYASGEDCQPYLTVKTQTTPYSANYPLDLQYYAFYIDPLPTTQDECERARLELASYHFDDNGGYWSLNGTQTKSGVWNGTSCTIGYAKLDRTMTCNALGKCKKAQAVSARAYVGNAYWFPTAKRVHAGIFRTD